MLVKNHIKCPDQTGCRSSDGASLDDSGSVYCFSCKQTFRDQATPDETASVKARPSFMDVAHALATSDFAGNPSRGITADTARLYRCAHGVDKTHYGYYSKQSPAQPVAIKTRLAGKMFPWSGDEKHAFLYGQQLFPAGGKFITITEGEEDAMAAYQLTGSKYPVVSIKNGASAALTNCKTHYEWLESFETIVICFDSDEAGHKAAKEVAQLFGGKSKIMKHIAGAKDACDYYKLGKAADFVNAWWRAERYTPDGIVSGESLREALKTPVQPPKLFYPWRGLNRMLRGIRPAELVTWCAGSGIGKSSMLREIVVNTLQSTEESVGLAFLEETPERTMRGIAGLHMNKPIHLDGIDYTGEEVDDAYSKLGLGHRVQFWEHWGSSQIDNVISRLRYMAKAMGSSLLVLDHISIVVSGDATTNERQTIDELMTRLRTEVVQQTNCSLHIVSHLTRPDGKPLELGAPVHLGLLRGSGSIAQLSDVVIAGERNSQAEDPTERNTIKLRVLKSRATGETGVACNLVYDRASGRLTELEDTL